MVKDPICGMDVDEKKTKWQGTYGGIAYAFCSESCKIKFKKTAGEEEGDSVEEESSCCGSGKEHSESCCSGEETKTQTSDSSCGC